MTNRNEVLRAAKQAGGIFNGSDWKFYCGFEDDELERFYAIAFKAGMERAAEICDEAGVEPTSRYPSTQAKQLADAIRAHAQNQPKNVHDTGNV